MPSCKNILPNKFLWIQIIGKMGKFNRRKIFVSKKFPSGKEYPLYDIILPNKLPELII